MHCGDFMSREYTAKNVVSWQPPTATPLDLSHSSHQGHALSRLLSAMTAHGRGTGAGPFLPHVGPSKGHPLLRGAPSACRGFLTAALQTEALPIWASLSPFTGVRPVLQSEVSPHLRCSVSSLSFTRISPNKSLVHLIPSCHLLLGCPHLFHRKENNSCLWWEGRALLQTWTPSFPSFRSTYMLSTYLSAGFPLGIEEVPRVVRFPDMMEVCLLIGWKKNNT